MGVATVGRPKKTRPASSPKPLPARTVGLRATGEWCAWLERAARHNRTDVAKFIDAAVIAWAKARGFDEPAPDRVP